MLIAYQENEAIDSKDAKKFVWETAEETFPPHFNIYITNQNKLFHEIYVLQKSQKNSDYLNQVDNIIKKINY